MRRKPCTNAKVMHNLSPGCNFRLLRCHNQGVMKRKQQIPDGVWVIARRQAGVISHAQVSAFGLTRHVIQRALDDKLWWQVIRGIYSLAPDPSWLAHAWAGVLLGGEGAVLGYSTAAHLYKWVAAPHTIDVLVPRRARNRGRWVFHQRSATGRGDLPITPPEQTALDVCTTLGPADTLSFLSDVLTSRLTTADRIRNLAMRQPNLPGRRMILEVLGDVAEGIHSHLEERFRTFVEIAHGLIGLSRQVRTVPGQYTDIGLEDYQTLIELDGQLGHDGRHAFRDRRRDNRNAHLGYTTLRYGWHDVVSDPCAVAREIGEVLRSRGWKGDLRRCPRCSGQ